MEEHGDKRILVEQLKIIKSKVLENKINDLNDALKSADDDKKSEMELELSKLLTEKIKIAKLAKL